MRTRQTIAAKIFGLALFLLLITTGLAVYLLVQAQHTQREMVAVAQLHMPLADAISTINEAGLRRRLAFERWFGALNSSTPNAEVINEASTNYALYTQKLNAAFAAAHALLDAYPNGEAGIDQIRDVQKALKLVELAYPQMSKRQQQLLDMQRGGEKSRANELLNLLNDQQASVQSQRESMRIKVSQLSLAAADRVSKRQETVLGLAVLATSTTILLGLLVAGVVTARLTRPVRVLASALDDARAGNLDQSLSVTSRDELGSLIESFNFFVQELRDKERIKRIFGRYIDQRVLEKVLHESDEANVSGDRRVMTVLFADLVGFTNLSERLTPTLMVALLNRHFGLQAAAVQEHSGVVDKFLGDAIMAFWGAPFVKEDEHSVLACSAALSQIKALDELRGELPQLTGLRTGTPQLDLRIGICSGEVVVGNIGSANTRSFTVIGDTVNLASRLEGANRVYGTRILLSERVALEVAAGFELREIDAVVVKGAAEAVKVYELLGVIGSVDAVRLALRDCYARALLAYREQNWDAAALLFDECLGLVAQDRASALMQERIAGFRVDPPGPGWNGGWQLDTK